MMGPNNVLHFPFGFVWLISVKMNHLYFEVQNKYTIIWTLFWACTPSFANCIGVCMVDGGKEKTIETRQL